MLVVISPLSLETDELFYLVSQTDYTPSSGVTHSASSVHVSVVKSVLSVVPDAPSVSVSWYFTPVVVKEYSGSLLELKH